MKHLSVNALLYPNPTSQQIEDWLKDAISFAKFNLNRVQVPHNSGMIMGLEHQLTHSIFGISYEQIGQYVQINIMPMTDKGITDFSGIHPGAQTDLALVVRLLIFQIMQQHQPGATSQNQMAVYSGHNWQWSLRTLISTMEIGIPGLLIQVQGRTVQITMRNWNISPRIYTPLGETGSTYHIPVVSESLYQTNHGAQFSLDKPIVPVPVDEPIWGQLISMMPQPALVQLDTTPAFYLEIGQFSEAHLMMWFKQ